MNRIPFSEDQFFSIFEKYNASVFPAQLIFIFLGIVLAIFVLINHMRSKKLTGGFLSLLWLWTGVIYHILFFSSINKAALAFGGLFILQGVFIAFETFVRKNLDFEFKKDLRGYTGYFFIFFGLILYPAVSYLLEGSFSTTITPGLPCPSTILTFGFFLVASRSFPKYLLIIPTIWAIIGTGAAINFGIYQDYVMLLAAIVANFMLLTRR